MSKFRKIVSGSVKDFRNSAKSMTPLPSVSRSLIISPISASVSSGSPQRSVTRRMSDAPMHPCTSRSIISNASRMSSSENGRFCKPGIMKALSPAATFSFSGAALTRDNACPDVEGALLATANALEGAAALPAPGGGGGGGGSATGNAGSVCPCTTIAPALCPEESPMANTDGRCPGGGCGGRGGTASGGPARLGCSEPGTGMGGGFGKDRPRPEPIRNQSGACPPRDMADYQV
mmetsp:Transcript_44394/g.96459  ORF Transcript_44394/g.96459 Transcript_44394/m.96459 type:complete len:234 (-) Transcript_44394:25-726(-)